MVSEGDLLAGKYRVERVLGEGGMGYVVSAMHEQLEQRVAVKLLVPELAKDRDAAARFLREARAAVRIQSEHVARVLDVGELADGAPYLVMEFLSGRDLALELDVRETFPIGIAIDYVLQACEAVAEAHALGVIHRDLKPANLFLSHRADGSPLVKVLDFGISKAMTSQSGGVNASPSLTAAQSLLGSPAYMSPEQARRPKTVDTRTDIWALGVVLYEFLGGETPFVGDAPLEVLTAAVSEPMPSLRALRPEVPPELEAVIGKCLEKKPENRYQTVADFADALKPFAPTESFRSITRISRILRSQLPPAAGASSTTLRSSTFPVNPEADTEVKSSSAEATSNDDSQKDTKMDWGRSESGIRRSRRRAAAALAAMLGLALIAWLGWRRAGERPPSSPPLEAAAQAAPLSAPALPAAPSAPTPPSTPALPAAPGSAASGAVGTASGPSVSSAPRARNAVAAQRSGASASASGRVRPPAAAAPSAAVAVDQDDPLESRH
jgi:serine/threonine protein kinase